ncbi:hypothetical protein SCUCBS95973_006204 [Sporothrix curviconia]|uniref:Heterokaryon incompatibility domain-containing protein n=1 Tax=Sporothrix curviconia TaxID=1260050 RepID=A0ABP0C372_9PEZI
MNTPNAGSVCTGCYVYWRQLDLWHTASFPAEKTSVARIEAGAGDGCPCCRIVVDSMAAMSPASLARVQGNPISVLWKNDSIAIQFRGEDNSGGLDIYSLADEPQRCSDRREAGAAFAARSEVVPDTRCADALRTANAWLDDCVQSHAGCARPFFSPPAATSPALVTGAFMPTRVLDVADGGGSSGQGHRVVLVESVAAGSPYAALSYCWGPDPSGTVTTKRGNVAAHKDPKRGIPLAALPQTIQDAVLVCRRLHVRYLWIDALCIVQDDDDDWRREAAQMCNVYQRSHVTIAAHRASACQHGFLGTQAFGQEEYQAVFWTDKAGKTTKDPKTRKKMLLRSQHKRIHSLPTAPLGTRAWTLQEVVLPRRLLHFFEYEMAWECQTTHHCECGDTTGFEAPHLPMLGLALRATEADDDGTANDGTGIDRSRLAKLNWMSLVEQYTKRSLTRLSDKLIAVDGLAHMVEGAVASTAGTASAPASSPAGGTPSSRMPALSLDNTVIRSAYVEGLFVADFAQQLMWGVSQNSLLPSSSPPSVSSPPRPTARRASPLLHAPSWSWASIDAPVGYSMIYSDKAESLLSVRSFSPCAVVGGKAKVTGVRLSASVVPAAIRTMASVDTSGQGGPARRRPLVSRPTTVRACNGFAYGVFCDDVQTPDLALSSPELPCWVADDSIHNNRVRVQWLSQNASSSSGAGTDTDTDNALTRSCQHNRVRHIRQVVQEDDRKDATSRWCNTCRVWPSEDVAWESIDAGITGHVGALPGLVLLVQVFRRREAGSYTVYFLALRPSTRVPCAWERFGFGHYVTWDKNAAYVDLFWGSKKRDLLLV